jgi:hypothetical protein
VNKNTRSTDPFASALAYTVDQGGGTFFAESCEPFRPSDGYAVAVGGVILDPAITGVLRLRNAWRHVASEFMTSLVGTWLDGDSLYVDAVIWFPAWQRDRAIAEGREHNQLAIFDFGTGESLTLTETED